MAKQNEKGLPPRRWGIDDGPLNGVPRAKFERRGDQDMAVHLNGGTKDDMHELSGFYEHASEYLDKKGTLYGEAAKLNEMPPGMDISHQEHSDIRDMPLKFCSDTGYPDDGWQ